MKYIKIFLLSLITLLVVGVLVGYILYRNANTELLTLDEAARKNASGSFVQLSDGITHYELAGPDSGKVVVLVHGFSVPYYIWDSTFVHLTNAGFRVLRYDEFGRGFSDRPDKVYEASLYRKQLSELLAALKISSVHAIAGLSFGGPVVSDFVINNSAMINKVILVDPVYPQIGPSKLPYPESVMRYLMALSPDDVVNGQWTDLKYPDRFPNWSDQYKVQMKYTGFRNALISTRFHYKEPDGVRATYRELDSLHKPVLLVWGKEDNTTPFTSSDSLRKILRVDFMPIDDAAHLPHMEKAQEVNDKIIVFLKAN
ncbi:MAG: alpha/beta hydrolase [Chryseolinea sp.]